MKKFDFSKLRGSVLLMLFMMCALIGFSQGTDDFNTLENNNSYLSSSTEAGWSYVNSAVGASTYTIGTCGRTHVVLNGKTTAVGMLTSPTITGGCGTLSFSYGYVYSESNGMNFKVQLVNPTDNTNVLYDTTVTVANADIVKGETYEFSAEVNVAADFVLIITNLSPSNYSGGNKDRLAISCINWTGYTESSEPVVIEPTWVSCEQVGIFNTQVNGLVPTCTTVGDSTVFHFAYTDAFEGYPIQNPNTSLGAQSNKVYVDIKVARPNDNITGIKYGDNIINFADINGVQDFTLGAPYFADLTYVPVATVNGEVTEGNATDRNWTITYEWCTGNEVVIIQKLNILVDAAPVEVPNLDVDSIATLPYAYDFDEGNDPYFVIENGDNVNKWYVGQAQGFDNNKLYISPNGGTTNKYDITKASTVTAYRDVMIPATGAVLSFDYRVNGQSNTTDYLKIDLNGTEIARLYGENNWTSFSYDISGEMAGEVRVQFTWVNNASAGNQFPAAIDNISIIETPCSQPTALAATMDSTTAVITWQAVEGQTAWNFQYKLADHSEWYTVPATATTLTLTDLQGNSNYDMRVQAVCGENVSAWTTGTFAVACQTEEITITPTDVVIGTGTSTTNYLFPGYYGWQYTAQLYEMSQYGVVNSIGFYLNTASSTAGSTMTVWVKAVSANYALATSNTFNDMLDGAQQIYDGAPDFSTAGWMTFPVNDFSLAEGQNLLVLVKGVGCSTSGGCTKYNRYTSVSNKVWYKRVDSSDPGQDVTGTLTSYRPNININMDVTVVTCDDQIACVAPTGLQVSDVTANSAVLTWTPGDENQTSFIVEYLPAGATEWTSVDVNDNTYTLTELAQMTYYSVKVKANCGENNWSDVITASFRTAGICAPVTNLEISNMSNTTTLTWTAGGEEEAWLVQFKPTDESENAWTSIDVNLIPMTTFGGLQGNTDYDVRVKALCDPENEENQSEWTSTTFHSGCAASDLPFAEEFPTNTMPVCWENQNFYFSTSGYAYSYSNGAELITPAINIPAENPTYLTFEVSGAGEYTVLASYRGTRADRFETIYTGIAPNQNTIVTIAIADLYKGRAVNFKIVNNSTSYQYFYNVKVNQCPFEVTSLNVAAYTGTTVDLAWEADEVATNFQVQYGEAGFTVGEGTNVDVTNANEVTISGLNYETAYDFYVRVVCTGDNGSWAGPISATTAPACSDPVNLNFDFTAAQLQWNKGEWGTPVQYNVRYKEESAEEYTTEVVNVPYENWTPFITISGLVSNVTYEMGVQSVCGENMESNWVTLVITTPCMPLTEIPYTQDFEGDVFPPECWSQTYVSGTLNWGLSTDVTYGSGSIDARFAASDYDLVTKLVTPAFDLSSSSNLILSFKHSQAEWAGDQDELRVYYRTSMSSNWELLQAYTSSVTSMTLEEIAIPAAAMSSSCQFAFEATANYGHGVYLDDVAIKPAPTCGIPSISVNGLTATITPNEPGTPAGYELMIGEQTATVTETSVDLSTVFTLEGSTTYQVSVRANCGNEDYSDWSDAVSFTTPCMPMALPYEEDFNSYSTSATSSSAPSGYPNHTMPLCWNFLNMSTSTSTYPQMFLSSYSTYAVSGNCLFFKSSNETPAYAVLPQFTEDIQNIVVSFTYRNEGTGTSNGTMYLGYMTDPTNPSTFVSVYTCTQKTTKTPVEYAFNQANVSGTNYYIAFRYTGGSYNNYYAAIDNVMVSELPSCPKPTAITVGTATETTAQVSWTAGGSETEWEVSYTIGDQTITETTTENPYTITGLSASTHYVLPFSVKAICSATDESEVASTELSINTVCGLAAVPFAENFDAYTSTTSQSTMVMPLCWNRKYTGTSTSYGAGIYNGSSYAVSSPNSLRLYNYYSTSTSYGDIYAVMPMMDAQLNTLMISFDAKKYSASSTYNSHFDVGVVTDAANPDASFTTVEAFSAIQEHGGRITVSLANYDGPAGYIAFRSTKERPAGATSTYTYVFIDNILVEAIPTCFVPSSLTVSEVTDHTAAVNWADNYDQAAYAVEYMAEGDPTWTSVSVDTTYTLLNNLQASTNYAVRVKAVCGDGDESEYTDVIGFTTHCIAGVNAEIAGTGTNQYYIPVSNFYNYSYTQQILTAEEINAVGTISSVSFEYAYSSAMTSKNNVRIYMANTDKSVFANSTDWITDGLQLVYEGSLNCELGWNEFALNTPFSYAGGNLAIVVEDNSAGYNSSSYTFKTTSTTYYSALTWQSDNAPYAGQYGDLRQLHSNIRLTVCPEPIDLAVTSISTFADACDVEGAVTIGVKNMGYEGTVSTFEAYYQVNEETPVHETVTLATPIAFNETAEYTFNQLPAFTASENIINAWVELTGDLVDANNTIASAPITVLDPKAVPYQEYFWEPIGWNSIDANNDGITMVVGNQGISYSFNDELAADDWMMSPCVELAAGTYTVTYDYAAESALTESFELFYGNGAHIADMTNLVATHTFNNTGVEIATTTITVPTDGIYNFGFHATSLPGNLGFNIYYFSVQPVNDVVVTYAENGAVTPEGTVAVNYGENLTLSIVPDPMYHVAGVWVDDVQVVPEDGNGSNFMLYTLENVTEPHTVFVDFKLEFHIIKTVENFNSSYADLGGAFVPAATDTTINPDPFTVNMVADPHYHLNSLTVSPMVPTNEEDVTVAVVDNGDGTYSYTIDTLVVANYYLNATFKRDTVAINYNVLTGKGYADDSQLLNAGETYTTWVDYSVNHDVNATSTFAAGDNYYIVDVIVNGEPQGRIESYSFTDVTEAQNVDLKFGYKIDASVSNYNTYDNISRIMGTITPESQYVAEFEPMTVTGTVEEHFHLYQLLVNGVDRIDEVVFTDRQNYSFTMNSVDNNYTIVAVVKVDTFAITYNVVNGQGYADESELLVAPATYYNVHNYGDNWFSTITPATGYNIENVTLDDQNLYTANNYQFNYLETSHVFNISFAPITYTITTNAYGDGTVSDGMTFQFDPENPVDYVFTATASEGYYISSITINNESVDLTDVEGTYTTTFENVTSNYNINVIFQMYTYTMTANVLPTITEEEDVMGGTITPSGTQIVNYGANVTYTVNAYEGYYISHITIDGQTTNYTQSDELNTFETSFTNIQDNHAIEVAFLRYMYTITASIEGEENGVINEFYTTLSTNVPYGYNDAYTFTPDLNYQVADVVVDGVSMGAITSYEFIHVTDNHNIAVSFAPIMYNLTATTNIASCVITPADTTVQAGSTVSYTITPATGYHLDNVTINGEIIPVPANALTIENVQANMSIFANFAPNTVTVTVEQPDHATITPSTQTYTYGATPTYMIVPEVGYDIVSVTAGNAVVSVSYTNGIGTFTLDALQQDITLSATTAIKKFTITVTQGANGTIAPATQNNVEYGSNKTFTITPNNYYVVADVIVDGTSRGALSSYTFYNVTGNHTITAVFEANCQIPTNLAAMNIDTTSAVLTWVGTAPSYQVRYKATNDADYTTQTLNTNSLQLTDLTPNTLYEWGVRAVCSADLTSDWATNAFTTKAVPVVPVDPTGIANADLVNVKVYSYQSNIYIVNEEGVAISHVDIYDIYGKQVYTGKVVSSPEVISLNVTNGNYIVRLATENGVGVYKVAIVR